MNNLLFELSSYCFDVTNFSKIADGLQFEKMGLEGARRQLISLNNELENIYNYYEALDCIEKLIFKKRQHLSGDKIKRFDAHTSSYLDRIKEQSTVFDIVNFHRKLIDQLQEAQKSGDQVDCDQGRSVLFELFGRIKKEYKKRSTRELVLCTRFLSDMDFC